MRFVDTHRLSPVANGIDLPQKGDLFHYKPSEIPNTEVKYREFLLKERIRIDKPWWAEQMRRCWYGYTIPNGIEKGGNAIPDDDMAFWSGNDCYIPEYDIFLKDKQLYITGRMYFFLNFWPIRGVIPGTKRKGITKPKFLDHQYLAFESIRMMFEKGLDNQFLKGRQLGFSELIAAILGFNMVYYPGTQNLIIGADSGDSGNTMSMTRRGLDDLINTQMYVFPGVATKDVYIGKYNRAELHALTAKNNVQTASNKTPFFTVYEEVGKGYQRWSLDTQGYVEPSQYAEDMKTGWSAYIGTGAHMEGGAYDLEERHFKPEENKILSFKRRYAEQEEDRDQLGGFVIPKTFFKVVDKDGNSDIEAGAKIIREEAEKKKTKQGQYLYLIGNPIHDDDIFQTSKSGYFGEETIMLLDKRRKVLRSDPSSNIVIEGVLEWEDPLNWHKGVKFKPQKGGWLQIIEPPDIDTATQKPYINLYLGGTDSYNQDESENSDSKGAMYVWKSFRHGQESPHYNTWVAQMFMRPSIEEGGIDLFHERTIMLSLYYNCKNNVEANTLLFKFYESNRMQFLLMLRPEIAFAGQIKNDRKKNRYGTDPSLKITGLTILHNMLTEDQIDRMYFPEQVYSLARFRLKTEKGKKYNCDRTIATMESIIAAKEFENVSVGVVKNKSNVRTVRRYKTVNGVMQAVYVNAN